MSDELQSSYYLITFTARMQTKIVVPMFDTELASLFYAIVELFWLTGQWRYVRMSIFSSMEQATKDFKFRFCC